MVLIIRLGFLFVESKNSDGQILFDSIDEGSRENTSFNFMFLQTIIGFVCYDVIRFNVVCLLW